MSGQPFPAEASASDVRLGRDLRTRLRIAMLVIAIFLPLPLGALGVRLIAFNENRNLAPFPMSSIEALNVTGMVKGIDAWIADRFAFRPVLIVAWNYVRFLLDDSASDDVLIGSDGWLYSTGESNWLDDIGAQPAGLPSIVSWRRAVVEQRDWVEKQGSRFLFVIPPQKESIYPEHLPPALQKRGTDTKATRLIDALRGTGVDVLYLHDALLARKAEGIRVYYKLDTHWNQAGALAGAKAIADHIRRIIPAVDKRNFTTHWSKPQVRWPEIPRGASSLNEATLLGLPFLKEPDAIIAPADGWRAKMKIIYHDHGYISYEFTRTDAPNLPTIVVYGDSYILALMRPLAEYFRRAVFVDPWESYTSGCSFFPPEFIRQEYPDIVVSLRFERGLGESVQNPWEVSGKPCR